VPHRFKIFKHEASGRAICQYMMFSPPDLKSEAWLPLLPIVKPGPNFDEEYKSLSVKLQQLATVNGIPNLKSYLSISGDVQRLNINETKGTIFLGALLRNDNTDYFNEIFNGINSY